MSSSELLVDRPDNEFYEPPGSGKKFLIWLEWGDSTDKAPLLMRVFDENNKAIGEVFSTIWTNADDAINEGKGIADVHVKNS